MRFQAATWSGFHMPVQPGLIRPSGETQVISVKRRPAPPIARVVLMSTDNTPELQQACAESGAFDFVHKENFRQEFSTVIQRICTYS
jgi:CheY-like chemotaxis protein